MHLRTLFIFGTRPEAIKMAPVIKLMQSHANFFDVRICVTAQHRQMLDDVLEIFEMRPDCDLDLMQKNQSLSELTASCIRSIDPVIARENPDCVFVQGDTTSAMAGALVSYYHRVRVAHIEAGLRTGDKFHPFPEEMNRRMIASIADIHFAPSQSAADNLILEGIDASNIHVVGNTSIDAVHQVLEAEYDLQSGPLNNIPFEQKRIIVVTAHRRENFGEPISDICEALKIVAARYKSLIHIVYPVHMNPNINIPVRKLLGGIANITLLEPLDYRSFIHLLDRSYIIVTDSGGIQEEAPSLGKPVFVLRKTTERVECVEAGTARIVGTKTDAIVREVSNLLENPKAYSDMACCSNPYGDGYAAQRICAVISAKCGREAKTFADAGFQNLVPHMLSS
jgi:UDP-N-acetylglucosamine 2-epimerase (non-hydrolysing)